jgi:tripartite-type tricarboxylate transporter receptor subunit TctC
MLDRRHVLQKLATLPIALAGAAPQRAWAAWPDKPIRLIVPSAAGGSPDVLCRLLAAELGKSLGHAVVIENKPGASGNIGMQDIVRAAPDGHTLGYGNVGTLSINMSLFERLPYQPFTQLMPVALMGFVHNALVVRNNLPVNDVAQLIALARSQPGKLVMASAGNGTTGHLGGELFKSLSGSFIVHVPYRGSPQAIQDLIGGQVDMMFDNLSSIGPHIRQGRVKALAVSGAQRSPAFPQLPTLSQAGLKDYQMTAWGGIVAPAGTPRDVVLKLNQEINKVLADPALAERWAQLAFEPLPGPPQQLFDIAQREQPMWAQVIKRAGAKVE